MFYSKMLSLLCCLVCGIALTYAQPTATATFVNPNTDNNALVIKSGGTTFHFNKLALHPGKNVKRLSRDISIEIVKSRTGEIVSVKAKKGNSNIWGPDVIAANPGDDQAFKCNPHICICSGIFDCFDMALSVCSENTDPICYDDDGGIHCSCVR